MRVMSFAAILAITLSSAVSTQSPVLAVNIPDGRSNAGLAATRDAPYMTGGGWAAVPAGAIESQTVTASDFRIRAWKEGTGARVVVFAVQKRPDGTEMETQIDTFVLNLDESRVVKATEKYGARPVSVSARLF
jgi:hypothetical protein